MFHPSYKYYQVPQNAWDECQCSTTPCYECNGTGKKYPSCHLCNEKFPPGEACFISLHHASTLCINCLNKKANLEK